MSANSCHFDDNAKVLKLFSFYFLFDCFSTLLYDLCDKNILVRSNVGEKVFIWLILSGLNLRMGKDRTESSEGNKAETILLICLIASSVSHAQLVFSYSPVPATCAVCHTIPIINQNYNSSMWPHANWIGTIS